MPFVSINGVELYYEETGEGDPILFLHEYAGDYRSWEHQVRHFARWYRCVTFNVRGWPPSDVPKDPDAYSQDIVLADIAALMDHLKIPRAHLVGLSMGSYTTLLFGLRHPDRTCSMVVAGTGYGALPETRAQYVAELDELSERFEQCGGIAKSEILSSTQSRKPLRRKNPRAWEEFAAHIREHSGLGSALTMRGVQKHRPLFTDIEEDLRSMSVPLLLMVGDEDPSSFDGTMFVKRASPTAGLCMFPQTGHTLNLEEPDLFNRHVQNFLISVSAGKWAYRNPRELAAQTTTAAG